MLFIIALIMGANMFALSMDDILLLVGFAFAFNVITGQFYYIALKAEVPIVMAYLDYKNRVCGVGPSIKPTGDIQADFSKIRDFYAGIHGKYPEKQGEIVLSEK